MSAPPMLAPDAAIALGIASTAMPFAQTDAAASECWLRILRLHGDAGIALQALGVGEGTMQEPAVNRGAAQATHARSDDPDTLAQIADEAASIASGRGADGIATTDLLLAVMQVYGADFDRALQAHGTDRAEVSERLGRFLQAS